MAGTWLRRSAPRGVVVEASFAAAVHVGVGDQISVQSVDAGAVRMTVIGIADTADQGFYPQWTPGLIWVLPPVLSAVEPATSEREYVVGLWLTDAAPVAAGQVAQEIYNAYNGSSEGSVVQRFSTSQQVENSMASDERLLGLLLALFGLIALGAAPCAIANVTAGRMLMYRQDIAMLKALGFTPGQVIRMLLAEQTGLGVAGALCGVALARVVTSPEFIRPPDGTPVGLAPLPGSWVTLIAVGTVLTVAIATGIPAWRAGLVSPVAAVQASPPRGHLSRIARLGLLVHLPAALVLGARDSLTLDLMHLSVGDLTGVTVDGVYVDVRIVGRIVYPDNNGDVLAFGLDALSVAGNPQPPQFYDVVLRPGVPAGAAAVTLLRMSRDQLDVQQVPDPAGRPGHRPGSDRGVGGDPGRDRPGEPAHSERDRPA